MAAAQPTARHYDTILAPLITEKSTLLSEQNKVVFKVADNATKKTQADLPFPGAFKKAGAEAAAQPAEKPADEAVAAEASEGGEEQ